MIFIASQPLVAGIEYVILFSFILFALGLIVGFSRNQIANALRILALSQKIVDIFSKTLAKIILLFR